MISIIKLDTRERYTTTRGTHTKTPTPARYDGYFRPLPLVWNLKVKEHTQFWAIRFQLLKKSRMTFIIIYITICQ